MGYLAVYLVLDLLAFPLPLPYVQIDFFYGLREDFEPLLETARNCLVQAQPLTAVSVYFRIFGVVEFRQAVLQGSMDASGIERLPAC
jgi:hypothetical protein